MIQDERDYWCNHCPVLDEFDMPIDEGRGFRSLRELAEHIEESHPKKLGGDSVEEAVLNILDDAESFITDVIEPAIEDVKVNKDDRRPLGVDWNGAIESEVTRLENKRSELRYRIREERNALNREYFHTLAETYADHWSSATPDGGRSTGTGIRCATAMAYEASEKLEYEVDEWMCFWYLQEELPEAHGEYDPKATHP